MEKIIENLNKYGVKKWFIDNQDQNIQYVLRNSVQFDAIEKNTEKAIFVKIYDSTGSGAEGKIWIPKSAIFTESEFNNYQINYNKKVAENKKDDEIRKPLIKKVRKTMREKGNWSKNNIKNVRDWKIEELEKFLKI